MLAVAAGRPGAGAVRRAAHEVHLVGRHGCFHFPACLWSFVLRLGRLYGWKARGETCGGRPDSCYCSPVGQLVSAGDAAGLGKAIARALPDLPGANCLREVRDGRFSLLELFSGDNRAAMERFARFCDRGPFLLERLEVEEERTG